MDWTQYICILESKMVLQSCDVDWISHHI